MPVSPNAFARDFLCEHTTAKSRVYALVTAPGRPNTLKAVLTCTDQVLAERIASVLASIAQGGEGIALAAEAETIIAQLPAAPAASLREALAQLREMHWAAADASPVTWDQLEIGDDDHPGPARRDEQARTPDDARLAQLTGKVVRTIQMSEYHVHDAARLLAAAVADGWPALSEKEDDTDPDDDLIGAVMHFAGTEWDVPGADLVSEESQAELLAVSAGDELADWQRKPIEASFWTGWRLRAEDDESSGSRPDFTALFPVESCGCERDDCEICTGWQLTPRTADALHSALSVLSDQAYDDVAERGNAPVEPGDRDDWWVFDRLPRLTWTQDAHWRRRFARACDDLVTDLEKGEVPEPRSNAEEMALHLAIRDAPRWLEVADENEGPHNQLPEHRDDYDWDLYSEMLFQDHDVLMLFNEGLDGIEDPGDPLNREAGMGDLRPAAWFEFFNNVEPRDPNRVFRR
jgi:hypothetical protein